MKKAKFKREVKKYENRVDKALDFFVQPGSKKKRMFIEAMLRIQQIHGINAIDFIVYELEEFEKGWNEFAKDLKRNMK